VTTQDGEPVSTLRDYLRILRRRKWIVIPGALIAPLLAIVLALREPTLYEASAQVLVNRANLAANLAGVDDPTQLDSPRILSTETQLARVPSIAQQAVEAVGIPGRTGSDLLGASSVSQADENDVLTFSVTDNDPKLAAALATEYANQFVDYRLELDRELLDRAHESVVQRIAELEAAGDTDSSLYSRLVESRDRLLTMETLLTPRAELIRPATGAGRIPNHVPRDALLGLMLGLISSIGLALLIDALDSRIRTAEEISDNLHLRLLGRLPRPPRRLRRSRRLVMLAEPESPHAEAYRMLRTSLEFLRLGQPEGSAARRSVGPAAYRIMITSAVEREGKSTTIGNLAVAFARSGRRVILVDLDFRRASLHRFFDIDPEPGLMDMVVGSASLREAVRDVPAEPGLSILPVGSLPAHAKDLALTVGLERALEQVGSETDIMLIDGPPLLRVGDAMALTPYVDGLLVVANLGTVRAKMLDELSRILDPCPAARLGLIVTGADLEGGYEYLRYPYDRELSLRQSLARLRSAHRESQFAKRSRER
jgi:succinoglycan biosynthesis transport protein ExoP